MTMEMKITPQIQFANRLASNDPKLREQAIKKLTKWLKSRSSGGKPFDKDELLTIWKGLFYCMWMCDKPLVQEKLADKISEMIHCFGQLSSVYMFIDTFFQTMSREWYGLDRYRIEKFMMFVRRFLRQSFHFLKQRKWKPKPVRTFLQILETNVLNATYEKTPAGLKIHVSDVYLEELARVGEQDFKTKKLLKFLDPYCKFLVQAQDMMLVNAISKNIFLELIESEEQLFSFKLKYNSIAKLLLQRASEREVNNKNRTKMYILVNTFRNAAKGIFSSDRITEDRLDFKPAISKNVINASARSNLDYIDKLREEQENWKNLKKRHAFSKQFTSSDDKNLIESRNGLDLSKSTDGANCSMNNEIVRKKLKMHEKYQQKRVKVLLPRFVVTPLSKNTKLSQKRSSEGFTVTPLSKAKISSGKVYNKNSEREEKNFSKKSELDFKDSKLPQNIEKHSTEECSFATVKNVSDSEYLKIKERNKVNDSVMSEGNISSEPIVMKLSDNLSVQKSEIPLSVQKSEIPSINNTAIMTALWNKKTSAKSVYSALRNMQQERTEPEAINEQKTDNFVNSSGTNLNIETDLGDKTTINIQTKSSKKENSPAFTNSKSALQNASFAKFEKFVATPPCFFRKSASKAEKKPLTTSSGILKSPFQQHLL